MGGVTVYFDFETGGVEERHPSIQLAAIAVSDDSGIELGAFEQKIKFNEKDCDPVALEINHYNPEAWKDAVEPAIVATRFSRFLDGFKCVKNIGKRTGNPYYVAKMSGYNVITFDWPRLKQLFGSNFLPCSYHVRDVLQRVIFWFDENPQETVTDYKLGTVCSHFNISTIGAHDALADVRMTAKLARVLKES